MATDAEITREYHEARFAYETKFAEAAGKDEYVALPVDVRQARVALECVSEAERLREAAIALDNCKAEKEERWISAHEYLKALREGNLQ